MENILELHNKTPVWNDGIDGEREREREGKEREEGVIEKLQ